MKNSIENVTEPKYKISVEYDLKIENKYKNWYDIFSDEIKAKKNERLLPGFSLISKNKYSIISHTNECLVFCKSYSMKKGLVEFEITNAKDYLDLSTDGILPSKIIGMKCDLKNNYRLGILYPSAYSNSKILLDLYTGHCKLLQFKTQPFKNEIGDSFLIIGTRDGYYKNQLPSEMYKLSSEGDFLWGTQFNYEIDMPMFGPQKITPYYIDIVNNNSNIIVTSYWLIFIFDLNGNLIGFIDVTSLDSSKKYTSIFGGVQTTSLVNGKPLFDISSRQIFILEESGRISAWSLEGKLLWNKILQLNNEEYNNRTYFGLINGMVLVINTKGQGFWIDFEGNICFTKQYPICPLNIFKIPGKSTWVFTKLVIGTWFPGYNTTFILNEDDYTDLKNIKHSIISDYNYVGIPDVTINDIFTFRNNIIFEDKYGYLYTKGSSEVWGI